MTTMSAPYGSTAEPVRIGNLLAVIVVVGGLAIGIVSAVTGVLSALSAPAQFDRAMVGESVTANVAKAGPVVVYVEGSGRVPLENLGLSVIAPSGAAVAVRPYAATLQYDHEGGLGTAVGTFIAPEPGDYEIASAGVRTGVVIAVGPDLGTWVIDGLRQAGLLCTLALVAGLSLAAASAVMSRR
jgi:hypothetical protein